MVKQNYTVLGVMSGTSLDGVDIAKVTLQKSSENWTYILHEAETVAYSSTGIINLKML